MAWMKKGHVVHTAWGLGAWLLGLRQRWPRLNVALFLWITVISMEAFVVVAVAVDAFAGFSLRTHCRDLAIWDTSLKYIIV